MSIDLRGIRKLIEKKRQWFERTLREITALTVRPGVFLLLKLNVPHIMRWLYFMWISAI